MRSTMNQTLKQLSHPEGLTRKGQKRREEIISLARQRLINSGQDAVVLREIADEMGSSLGRIQYYFRTRWDLVAAVVAKDISVGIEDAISAGAEGSPDEKLKKFCDVFLARCGEDSVIMWSGMWFFRHHYEEVQELMEFVYGLFYGALIEIIGEICPEDSKVVLKRKAMMVTSLLDGVSLQPVPHKDLLSNIPGIALGLVKDRK